MMKRVKYRRAVTIGCAAAASLMLTVATSPFASADTMRTLNLSVTCGTGAAHGLLINTGNGFYAPDGSSSAGVFTVFIPASATSLSFEPLSCDGEPYTGRGPYPGLRGLQSISISPGTSTINANGICEDYNFYGALLFDTSITGLTYS